MGIYGQDWSSYQSATPDCDNLAFAFVKVTQGLGYTNPNWQAQRAHAASAGLVVGLYHYPDMANSPQTEADHFLTVAQPGSGELVALDWEGYDAANLNVPKATQAAYKDAWIAHVRGRLPHNQVGLYCNKDYWLNVDTTSDCGDFLWIATAGLPAGQPGIQHPWLFHQFSSTPVDQDYCSLADAPALRQWALAKATAPTAPTAPPSEEPVTPADAELFVTTLLGHVLPDAGIKNPDGTPATRTVADYFEYLDLHYRTLLTQVSSLSTQVTALSAAVTALEQHSGAPSSATTAVPAPAAPHPG
jgi:Glycosyl hydrolases family 25